MTVELSPQSARQFQKAPEEVQKAFGKQLGHLLRDSRHRSLDAKRYDEARDSWQARVTYHLHDTMPHPE